MKKTCIKCKETLTAFNFYKDTTRKDFLNQKCKSCDSLDAKNKRKDKQKLKKMKYPAGTILTDQYTTGSRLFLNNKSYIGWFHIIKKEFFTGRQPGPYSKKLIQYQKDFPTNKKEKPLDLNMGYYIKKINEGFARSVGINEFEQYKNNSLYKTIEVNKNDPESIYQAKQIIPELKNLI